MIDYREALDLENGLPGEIRDGLEDCPVTGSGERRVFRWVFRMAKRSWPYCDEETFEALILKHSSECGRTVTQSEIVGAFDAARTPQLREHTDNHRREMPSKKKTTTLADRQ